MKDIYSECLEINNGIGDVDSTTFIIACPR